MKTQLRLAASLVLLAAIAGCEPLGDGSTIEKLEIVPGSSEAQLKEFEPGDTHKVFQCFRDELFARATFTDGTVSNFSFRAAWSTSDASVIEVSNGDMPAVFIGGAEGSFTEHANLTYAPGTVVPKGAPGDEAVVTATFAGLSASIRLKVSKPSLRIVPVPNSAPAAVVDPVYLGEGTSQRLTVLADMDGRMVTGAELSAGALNSFTLNPLRWVFPGRPFEAKDPDVASDFDKWVIEEGGVRIATLENSTGRVRGHNADFNPYEVAVETKLCEGSADLALRPVSHVQVASFKNAADRFVLSREANFNGSGFEARDLVKGTSQQLGLVGTLDANGDGSLFVEQDLSQQVQYQVLPLNLSCEVADDLVGCISNSDFFMGTTGLVAPATGAAEGDVARVQACLPFCLAPQATLDSDAPRPVASGVMVNFTASSINAPADVSLQYVFDFGDGTTVGPQAGATTSHAYAADGAYTATVRLVDAAFPAEFLSQNAGAVRVLVGTSLPASTKPTATLGVSPVSGNAPVTVRLTASAADADEDDSVTVYEFDPGDGSPIVRQTRPTLSHVYLDGTGGPFTPTLKVYDESGLASDVATGAQVTVEGVSLEALRSNTLDFRVRDATLCAAEIQPPLASAPTEEAFTFPGTTFTAVGTYVANTDTDTCTDPVIGTQSITRLVAWLLRPSGSTTETSEIADVRRVADDFRVPGQVRYLQDVTAATPLDVTGTLPDPNAAIVLTPSQLTVTPCTGCMP